MARVKRGTISLKHRRNVLKRAKGYQFGRSKKEIEAKVAIRHAGVNAFAHRRDKKNDFRKLWSIQINAGVRKLGTTYSKLIGALKKQNIELNRKVLATIAREHPATFERVIKKAS